MKPYFKLLRPGTLIPPMIGGALFSLMGVKINDIQSSFVTLFLVLLNGFVLALANAISNIMNQVHDRDADKLQPHKRNRPIPSGTVSVDEALSIVVVLMIMALSLAWFFFPPFYGVILSIILVFSWMYNSPPLHLKTRLFWSNFAIATPRGALGIIAAYSTFANPIDSRILIPALALGIYVYGANTFKDYEDCEIDKKMDVRNFCTVYGKEKASHLILPFLYIPFVIFALHGNLATFVVLLSGVIHLIIAEDPALKGKGTLMWRLFYVQFSLMILVYTLPFLLS